MNYDKLFYCFEIIYLMVYFWYIYKIEMVLKVYFRTGLLIDKSTVTLHY